MENIDAVLLDKMFERMSKLRVGVSVDDLLYQIDADTPLQYRLAELLELLLWFQQKKEEIPLNKLMDAVEQKLDQIKELLRRQPGGPADHTLIWGIPKSRRLRPNE
jgi:hypothetical protein